MTRILVSALIWVVLIGGLTAYMRHRDAKPVERPTGPALVRASGRYALELTPSFSPEPDPFSIDDDTLPGRESPERENGSARRTGRPVTDAPAVVAQMTGVEIYRHGAGLEAGKPVLVDGLAGVREGENEIAVAAAPPLKTGTARNFLLARVLRDGVSVASETFWAEGSARVAGVVRFTAPSAGEVDDGE